MELAAGGQGEIKKYTLSESELEEIRKKYPAPKKEAFKVLIPMENYNKSKGDSGMVKFKLTADQYFAERTAGKSLEQIAKENGVTAAAIDYHLGKWAKEGKIDPGAGATLQQRIDGADPQLRELQELRQAKEELSGEVRDIRAEVVRVAAERDELKGQLAQQAEARPSIGYLEAVEAAVTNLTGVEAYMIGATIERLWSWCNGHGSIKLHEARGLLNQMIGEEELPF